MASPIRTREAAAIVGIGYEGLRTWLKRGVLARGSPARAGDLAWRWGSFGEADLCLLCLAKRLLDIGIPLDRVVAILAAESVRVAFAPAVSDPALLVVTLPDGSFQRRCSLAGAPEALAALLPRFGAVAFLDLAAIRLALRQRLDAREGGVIVTVLQGVFTQSNIIPDKASAASEASALARAP